MFERVVVLSGATYESLKGFRASAFGNLFPGFILSNCLEEGEHHGVGVLIARFDNELKVEDARVSQHEAHDRIAPNARLIYRLDPQSVVVEARPKIVGTGVVQVVRNHQQVLFKLPGRVQIGVLVHCAPADPVADEPLLIAHVEQNPALVNSIQSRHIANHPRLKENQHELSSVKILLL